jgi:octaprenyl-diphosphate synthase
MSVPENIPWRGIPSFGSIDSQLTQVHDLIRRSLGAPNVAAELSPLLDHLVARRGKMLRPGLVPLTGKSLGPLTEEHIRVAAMVEMIHDATLLHDDVIDDGHRRRGAPTVNHLWGNESAVLLGDFVLSQVFRMAADLDGPVARIVAQTAERVCEGELRQVIQKSNWRLSEAEYIDIITEKSAAFFSGCCRLGAGLAHADENQTEALARFGLLAGIAFQITDDLLDIAGDEKQTGKTTQSDFAKDKLTLAAIHLLRTVGASREADIHAMLESPDRSGPDLTELLVRHGSLQYAREQAEGYVVKAIESLESLPSGKAKDALVETARFMAGRAA